MNTVTRTTAVDWVEVHRRVESARQATEAGGSPSPEAKTRILRARAAALAVAPPPPVTAALAQVVIFRLTGETYAVDLPLVREVHPLRAYTPLPCTPPFVFGLINVRGQIVSVIDLRTFFELATEPPTPASKIILLKEADMEFGLLADAVLGVRSVDRNALVPALPTLTGVREAFLQGITPDRVALLDGQRLLADRRLRVQEHVED